MWDAANTGLAPIYVISSCWRRLVQQIEARRYVYEAMCWTGSIFTDLD